MKKIIIALFVLTVSAVEASVLLDAIIGTIILNKIAKEAHIPSIINADAEIHSNVLGDINAAYGVGEEGTGVEANVNGYKLDWHDGVIGKNELHQDKNGRYYILEPQYINNKKVLARKYLTAAEVQAYRSKQNSEDYEINNNNNNARNGNKGVDRIPKNPTAYKKYVTRNVPGSD